MSIWSTIRLVPAIAPEAIAWALISCITYLVAREMPVDLWGRSLDPLALALAVQLVLILTRNAISVRAANAFRNAPVAFILVLGAAYSGLVSMALFASDAIAAHFLIAYLAFYSATLGFMASKMPDELPYLQGVWTSISENRSGAVKLEAAGLLVCATTLLAVWMFANPVIYVVVMSFGVLAIRWFTNWIVVLYLLDADNRAADTSAADTGTDE